MRAGSSRAGILAVLSRSESTRIAPEPNDSTIFKVESLDAPSTISISFSVDLSNVPTFQRLPLSVAKGSNVPTPALERSEGFQRSTCNIELRRELPLLALELNVGC